MRWLLATIIVAGCATAPPPIDRDVERAFYQQTVEGLRGSGHPGDPARLDYPRFRQAARLALSDEEINGVVSLLEALAVARARDDRPTIERVLDQLLAANFADAQVHLEKARALHFHHRRAAAFHEAVALGLLHSIVDSGDGDRDRPWRVFHRREEEVLAAYLDLSVETHTTIEAGGRTLHVLACRDRRGGWRRLHFDASPPRVKP